MKPHLLLKAPQNYGVSKLSQDYCLSGCDVVCASKNLTPFRRTVLLRFEVCKSVHHHTIQIYQPTGCKNFSSLLLDVYVQLNMFRASSRPLSGAQQLQ